MKIRIKYFGIIAEERGKSEEELELSETATLETVTAWLTQYSNTVREKNFRMAVNQAITEGTALNDRDEIAYLPPFSGG